MPRMLPRSRVTAVLACAIARVEAALGKLIGHPGADELAAFVVEDVGSDDPHAGKGRRFEMHGIPSGPVMVGTIVG